MFKRKDKNYLVTLITEQKEESMQVRAKSRKKAEEMVADVLLKCSIFGFNSRDEFRLKSRRMRRDEE